MRTVITLLIVAGLTLVACGESGKKANANNSSSSAAGSEGPTVELKIAFSGVQKSEATLSCNSERSSATGFLASEKKEPGAQCELARTLVNVLTEKPNPRRICTQIYGGPDKAHVTGKIGDVAIDRRFSRTNGCEIADWKKVAQLFSGAALSDEAKSGGGTLGPQ